MIVRKNPIKRDFNQVDRAVFTNRDLSDGACRLYSYLVGLKSGANFSDTFIMQALNISQTVLTRRKKELKDHDLILVDKVGPRQYFLYIGYSDFGATRVKQSWDKLEDKIEDIREGEINVRR